MRSGGPEAPADPGVLDTNAVISSLLFPEPAGRLLELWKGGSFRLLASAAIVREYARVLAYPKFRLGKTLAMELLEGEILPFVEAVRVGPVPAVIAEDPADDEFLACAVKGRADAVVSGDRHLLRLRQHRGIPILRVAEFLARWPAGS